MERHGPTMTALAPVGGDLGGWTEIPSESPMPVPLGTAVSARASSRGFSSSCPRAASTLNPTRGFFDTNMRGTYEASFSRRRPFETDGTNAQNSTPPCVGVVRRQRQPTGDALAASVGNDSSSESTSVCSDGPSRLRSHSLGSGHDGSHERGESAQDLGPCGEVAEEGTLAGQPPSMRLHRCLGSASSRDSSSSQRGATGLSQRALDWSGTWQVADELGQGDGMAAPRYLLVRLGERIPAETGAAPIHLSRLEFGPQWREFLGGSEPHADGICSLKEILRCPCCLTVFRQPVALPCGHTLCRGCYAQILPQPARRCPLCRREFPHFDVRVNYALSAVCDSYRAHYGHVDRPVTRSSHVDVDSEARARSI